MVVKRCPHCDQTLPVACKSCHCGHIFISKTKAAPPPPPQSQEDDSNDSVSSMNIIREKRQRAKRENPDFEYCFPSNVNSLGEPTPISKRQRNLSSSMDPGDELMQLDNRHASTAQHVPYNKDNLGEITEPKKKRGRPKGSKNKPKVNLVKVPSASPGTNTTPSKENVQDRHGAGSVEVDIKKKRGRPKGSKNKPKSILASPIKKTIESSSVSSSSQMSQASRQIIEDIMPVVTREKAAAYSLILGDLNQKMKSQSALAEKL